MNGKIYTGDPVVFHPKQDYIFEDPKNITINLHHRIAQYVKIQLYFKVKWILVSEVTFDAKTRKSFSEFLMSSILYRTFYFRDLLKMSHISFTPCLFNN